jgi:hypothetical protein
MTSQTTRASSAKKSRSPELERLIRSLDQVATDLPRILREEKAAAFAQLETVDAFEAHMREIAHIPAHLEALSRAVSRSLQVNGATDHLSRLFRAISTARGAEPPFAPIPKENASDLRSPVEVAAEARLVETRRMPAADTKRAVVDPSTGDLRTPTGDVARFHPLDLNLERVREALVPGGAICGRSMFESSRARLVTARATGEGPWRFQFRRGSLEWAAEGGADGLRGVAALICGDRGYVSVPARLLLERGNAYLMRSTGGNPVLRPSVAVYGAEAILHPGAMARTRPGDATKHVFVEF